MAWLDYDGLLYFWQKLKTKLEGKVDKVEGKGLSSNDFTAAYKTKLDGIANGANNYSHPTNSGNKHIPSGGSAGQILRWSKDGEAQWGADKGSVSSVDKLPTSNQTVGDVYDVGNGMNYAWDGTKWDALGEVFTITKITNTEIDTVLAS